jgi:hypothetical protein
MNATYLFDFESDESASEPNSFESRKNVLREKIIKNLKEQGFSVDPGLTPSSFSKSSLKQIQAHGRLEQISIHKKFLKKNLSVASKYCPDGTDIDPLKIDLELKEVKNSDSLEERLFRWWNFAWWSIPYQRPYGRQMRFLLWDTYHDSLFGQLSLQSPILKQSVRDNYLRIPSDEADVWVNRSLNAQRVGALPPYNQLIGGKMVALALTSNEIREAYRKKYSDTESLLKKRKIDPNLLFITTTSAFGKSSMYDRLKYKNEIVAQPLGYTEGAGSFHISEALFLEILELLKSQGVKTERKYGNGPSRRLRLLAKSFRLLGLPNFEFHGLKREYFLFPLVRNLCEVIQRLEKPLWYERPFGELAEYWKNRWALPRAKRKDAWKNFNAATFFGEFEKTLDQL